MTGAVKYLKKIGFLDREAYGSMLVIQLRKFLNVSSLKRIPEISQVGAYRIASAANVDPYILFTWLRMCDSITDDQEIERKLDIAELKGKIPLIERTDV